jgi:hypothetical protein
VNDRGNMGSPSFSFLPSFSKTAVVARSAAVFGNVATADARTRRDRLSGGRTGGGWCRAHSGVRGGPCWTHHLGHRRRRHQIEEHRDLSSLQRFRLVEPTRGNTSGAAAGAQTLPPLQRHRPNPTAPCLSRVPTKQGRPSSIRRGIKAIRAHRRSAPGQRFDRVDRESE